MSLTKFREDGYYVARGVVSASACADWLAELEPNLIDRPIDPYNPVDYRGPMPNISAHPALIDIAAEIVGPDVGVYYQRILVKDDRSADDARPWHQDAPYFMGFDNKLIVFVALTAMTEANGPLRICPGTHRYGSLGDVGSINIDALGVQVRGTILLQPGDVLVMDGHTIHGGTAMNSGSPRRILGYVCYQPASDPSTDFVVRGSRGHGAKLPRDSERDVLFHSSRVSKMRAMQAKLDHCTEWHIETLR